MVNLRFPLTPDTIRKAMQAIIEEIKEETDWEIVRDLSEITIELGNAPEYDSTFGVIRNRDRLIFGTWLNDLTPKVYKSNHWEFLLIRESLTFFVTDELLFDLEDSFKEFIFNITAIAKWRSKYDRREFETRLYIVVQRTLSPSDDETRSFYSEINDLLSNIVTQRVNYRIVLDTYKYFLYEDEDFIDYDSLDTVDIYENIKRYFSIKPNEIIAPIKLRGITFNVIDKITEESFGVTLGNLAEMLEVDTATISRELTKISNRYKAKFRVEKNHYKLGLHYYSIIIKLDINNSKGKDVILNDLERIRYIPEIYQGSKNEILYFYAIALCPHIIADQLENKLNKRLKNKVILSSEVKPLKERLFRIAFVTERFVPTNKNFKLLLDGGINVAYVTTWTNNRFEEDEPVQFSIQDRNKLRFMSIYISHSLVNPQLYYCRMTQLKELLEEEEISLQQLEEFLGYMNRQRNILLDENLIDFRLILNLTGFARNDLLIIKISCDPDSLEAKELIDKLSVFSWVGFNITYDSIIFRLMGINHKHRITELIINTIKSYNFDLEVFTVKNIAWRFVPLHDLYVYQGNLWGLK